MTSSQFTTKMTKAILYNFTPKLSCSPNPVAKYERHFPYLSHKQNLLMH